MPTYLYEIVARGKGVLRATAYFEIQQRMSDPPLTRHPETGQPVRRVIARPSILPTKSSGPSGHGPGQCCPTCR